MSMDRDQDDSTVDEVSRLRAQVDAFRAMADSHPALLWSADTTGMCTEFNRSWLLFRGRSLEEEFGVGWLEGVHPDDSERCMSTYLEAFDRCEPFEMEYRLQRADGVYRWILDRGAPRESVDGEFAGYIGSCVDVTEHRAREEELTDSKETLLERFHELADNVDVGFLIRQVDPPVYVYLNPAFRKVFGFDADGPVPTPAEVKALVHPDDAQRVSEILTECALGQRVEAEFRLTRPDGGQRWVSARFTPVVDTGGQIRRIAGLFQDITERRSVEDVLLLAQAESQRANAAKSEFLSRLSHELRTPLNAVLGFGQLLELAPLTPDQDEAVAHILFGGRHLLTMIDDVLDVSRIDSGRLELSLERVVISELVQEVLGLMQPLAAANRITLRVIAGDECSMFADRRRLKQILLNLVSNAIKYNRPHGRVDLVTRSVGDREVSIAVTDTGLGIAREDLPRLFEPFDRLGRESSPIEGTGIGLTLTRSLATLMSGRVDVDSIEGAGTTFTITLPSAADRLSLTLTSTEAVDADVDEPQQAGVTSRQSTLLYIEDNPSNVALLSAGIRHRPAWALTHAGNGMDGLGMAIEIAPTLILLDLHLPDIDGAEVLRRLKSDPASAAIPVVILSADASPTLAARMRAAGADRYLTKPVDLAELFAFLDAHAVEA